MKHLGDITQISGTEIEPVDIITFGSPCQDLSVAGKRAGIQGERSGLYKVWDEHGQQLAGYKGKPGVPVVVMYPDKHEMAVFEDLEQGIRFLTAERQRYLS